jgi:hypothetical protein
MSIVLILFCVLSAVTLATAFLNDIYQKPDSLCDLFGDLFFLDCGTLLIIEFAILGYGAYHCLFGCDHDSVLIHDHVDEFE